MGPAEIVASLKELCAEKGPRLGTDEIVAWIERIGGFETNAELVAFAKKMKARQYARMLEYEDEDSGMRIKRLWSFHDQASGTPVLCRHPRAAGGRSQAIDPPVHPFPQADSRRPQGDGRLFRRPAVFRLLFREPEEEEAEFEFRPPRGRSSDPDERRNRWLANGPPFA